MVSSPLSDCGVCLHAGQSPGIPLLQLLAATLVLLLQLLNKMMVIVMISVFMIVVFSFLVFVFLLLLLVRLI